LSARQVDEKRPTLSGVPGGRQRPNQRDGDYTSKWIQNAGGFVTEPNVLTPFLVVRFETNFRTILPRDQKYSALSIA
jgi:hypothetical protein